MCGIAGAKGPKERIERTLDEVRRMVVPLGRRGPDGAGFGAYEGTAFGHARLAIIDLQTGDQPQGNADDSVVVCVNGEIYNYVELRAALEAKGHRFKTHSDIEVIPHLYDEHGLDFVAHLRGMFAIALLDRRADRLVLVRDRLGKKPIYWLEHGECVYFASELKALMQVPDARFELDRRAVDDYFTYQYIPSPRTIFKDVRKVPAASMVVVEGGRSRTLEYWRLDARPDAALDEARAIAEVERVFDEAVRIRLRSDVPLGAFLSGGIDSNLVTATAAKMVPGRLKTTTIAFGDANRSEVELARRSAARLGTDHREKTVQADIAAAVLEVGAYLDEPLGDSSTVPTYLVSKAAREDVTVAISGDGGDETFGGYAFRYHQNLFLDRVRGYLPGAPGRALVGAIARAYPKLDRLPQRFRLKWGLRNLSVSAEDAYCLDMSIFRPEDKDALYSQDLRAALEGYDALDSMREHFGRAQSTDLLNRLLYVDLKTYLADGVLAKVDRMSMASSLEVRAPLLDHELVELAARIPSGLKMRGRQGKYLLRRIAEKRVGEDVARAPKMGFAPPIRGWLRRELRPMLEDLVLAKSSFAADVLDPRALRRLYDEHQSGARHHERLLWCVLALELWHRHFGARSRVSCAS
jgi:asparagine synthase (glutamine-hydrolysing)